MQGIQQRTHYHIALTFFFPQKVMSIEMHDKGFFFTSRKYKLGQGFKVNVSIMSINNCKDNSCWVVGSSTLQLHTVKFSEWFTLMVD